jgi:hypothetical protein
MEEVLTLVGNNSTVNETRQKDSKTFKSTLASAMRE